MVANGVKLMPVARLLEKEFFIRSYQRGYRWEEDQVKDLLNDFADFISRANKDEEEFYCLQPVVTKKILTSDIEYLSVQKRIEFASEVVYEVIDGQQRITTIFLLLKFLEFQLKDHIKVNSFPIITYEERPESKLILSNFIEKISSNSTKLAESIDFYHMQLVYSAIVEWFKDKEDLKFPMLKLLTSYELNPVKVIWYEVNEQESSIDVFRRFNIGKIPLNNAELIKALFLKDDNNTNTSLVYSISKEWQNIENNLRSPYLWSFLNPTKKYELRIEYLFDLLFQKKKAENNLKDKSEKLDFNICYGTDHSNVFRYFYKEIIQKQISIGALWDEVVEIYEKINQWFKNPSHYHYIGFLQNCESTSSEQNVILLLLTHNDGVKIICPATKEEVTKLLVGKIKGLLPNLKNFKTTLSYKSSKTILRDFFFLFNVEMSNKLALSGSGEEVYRLPFALHSSTNYDIEHIHSQTDKSIDDLEKSEQIDYLRDLITDYKEELTQDFNRLNEMLFIDRNLEDIWISDNVNDKKLKEILEELLDVLNEKLVSEGGLITEKDYIGNVAVLNDSINRSYGNSFFNTKRRRIIEEELKGTFIPIATKNVFLKYYSKNVRKHNRWSTSDMTDYVNVLDDTLKKFY